MDEKIELNKLCQKIKRMIPSNKIRSDATEPFTKFLMSLKEKGVAVEEIESIKRAYNYFNHIVSFEPDKETDESDVDEISPKDPTPKQIKIDEAVIGDEAVLSDEKMIQLLLSLYELENKRMAIADMKTIATTVLKSISKTKHDWIHKEIPKEKLNTLMGRLGYQAEIAKILNEIIPESDALLDATTNVLAIAQNEEAKAEQNIDETLPSKGAPATGGAFSALESIKEQTRAAQQSIAAKRVEGIVESLPKSILEAQEKVIEEVIKLESIL
jgi:hypothetical protein